MKKYIKKIVLIFLIIICYMGGLYLFQNNLLFYPDWKYRSPEASNSHFQEIRLTAKDGNLIRLWYASGDKTKPAILFLHGNSGQISKFADKLNVLIEAGYGVLAMEYRSFAEVPGTIRQDVIFSDAAQSFDFLHQQGYKNIVVYGYSFGAAMAAGLSSLREIDGLILTAPFYSLVREVSDQPVPFAKYVLRDEYPSYKYVGEFKKPLLIITGKNDHLISWKHAKDLFDLSPAKQKEIYIVDGQTHHGIYFDGANLPHILKFLKDFKTRNK